MVLTEARTHVSGATRTGPDFAYAAFWVLRILFVALPLAVGIDKYFDHFVDWTQYLWTGIPNNLHINATTFMHIAGIVEIVAALLVLFVPQLGAAAVTAWLSGIVANLLLVGFDEHEYWDIALRDAGLLLAAVALLLLATTYRPILRTRHRTPGI